MMNIFLLSWCFAIAIAIVAGMPTHDDISSPSTTRKHDDASSGKTQYSYTIEDGAVPPSFSDSDGDSESNSNNSNNSNGGDDDDDDDDEDPYCPLFSNVQEGHDNELETTLNVHLVPHTHDDVGWLKTVDQYFYGLNNTIQQAHVSLILDNVLATLLDDTHTIHKRTFTYVETKFFSKWYLNLPQTKQEQLQGLIANKQFSFANGGWCMHDEATTHYMGMIDQTTLGHTFLKEVLGVVPTVGWQIDPFGHSATQAGLLTADLGFDSLFFGRIHYVDLEQRQFNAECEGLWSSSSSSPSSSSSGFDDGSSSIPNNNDNSNSIFWGLTGSYGGNYGGPEGFCFDALCADDPLVGQSKGVLLERIETFVGEELRVQAERTKGRNIMLTMGMDFFYSQAGKNFKNLDLLIEATDYFINNGFINATEIFDHRFDKVNIFYSTPERYTQCKHADLKNVDQNIKNYHAADGADADADDVQQQQTTTTNNKHDPNTWNTHVKTGDFFPYADCDHCYWTGYFSSRQSLKRMERVGSSFLHAARQIEAMVKLRSLTKLTTPMDSKITTDEIEEGVVDADVDNAATMDQFPWIESLLSDGTWNASPLYTLDDAMGIAQHHDAVAGTSKQHVAYDYAKRIAVGMADTSDFVTGGLRELLVIDSPIVSEEEEMLLENLSYCHLLNETICEVSQDASNDNTRVIYVIVYNALAQSRYETISLPVNSSSHYIVDQLEPSMEWSSSAAAPVESSLVPNPNYANAASAAPFTLHFKANDLPPLGASVFRIRNEEEGEKQHGVSFTVPAIIARRNIREPMGNVRTNSSPNGYASQIENDLEVSNGVLSVTFDRSTGVIKSISEQHGGGITVDVKNEYGFYEAFSHEDSPATKPSAQFKFGNSLKGNGVCLPGYTDAEGDEMPWLLGTALSWQNAGAYIFRPTPDQSFHVLPPRIVSNLLVYESDLVTEVHAEFGNPAWIKQITRLVHGKDYVEVEYAVGPVPIDDGVGKEVVSRYSTTIQNEGIFYTDSNGREFMKRKRADTRVFGYDTPEFNTDLEPIAGNYYPVNAAAFIEDQDRSFGVLVDRSQGGSSLSDGSLELMIQRRLLHDDARGVGEPLNETDIGITPCAPFGNATRLGAGVVAKGLHRLTIGKNGASKVRSQMDQFFSQPHVFVASAPRDVPVSFRRPRLSLLKTSLPDNVMVLTYAVLSEENTFLLRLAHQYGMDEGGAHSDPAYVNLQDLFPEHGIASVTEKTLSANQDRAAWEKRRLRWNNDMLEEPVEGEGLDDEGFVVMLKPLEIRTFEVSVTM